MEEYGNVAELDASSLPLSDRIRFFQQGGKSCSIKNNEDVEAEAEEACVEVTIDYSSPPPVSMRKLLFNNSDCSYKSMNPTRQKTKTQSNNENSVAARAKLLDEKALKEKKAKSKTNYNEEIEKDVPPELLSLAERVKKFSAVSVPKKVNKKYGTAVTTTPSTSSKKWNNSIPSLAPSSPLSSSSSSSYISSAVSSSCLDTTIDSATLLLSIPPPPSRDDDQFNLVKNNLPYYRNWKSGTSGGNNKKLIKFPYYSTNNYVTTENSDHRKHHSTASVDWENSDQLSITSSSVSEITYY